MTENFNTQKQKIRVACFIDGFNLYHAIDALGKNHLKWVNLWALMERFIDPARQKIEAIYYFSAIAEWLIDKAARHKIYLGALKAVGVTPVLGSFKNKNHECLRCGNKWIGHEEKQTDVNIAVTLIQEAFRDNYDEAFLVSRDADLAPALQFVHDLPKRRKVKIIAPPGLGHSKELGKFATKLATIQEIHLEQCLLPERVQNQNSIVVATRPTEYEPPH